MAPLLFADNLWSVTQYALHGLTDQSGTTGIAGNEVWRIGQGRRSPYSFWQPGTPNAEAFVQVQCDQIRGANCCVIDRGHNLAGVNVFLQGSQNGTQFATVVNPTIATATGGQLGGANGVVTEEGAFLVTFPTQGFTYWRLDILAMGVGLQPNLVGVYLGMAYTPYGLYRPFGRHPTQLAAQEVVSPTGWRGRGTRAFNRAVALNVRMNDAFEYTQARFTLEELYGNGTPMWIVEEQLRATEAYLALRPLGVQGFSEPPDWGNPIGTFAAVEHEPLPLG